MSTLKLQDLGINTELASYFNEDEANAMMNGVESSFAIVSYRGKVWRIKHNGEETKITNSDGDVVSSIRVIVLGVNPHMSKLFYAKKYEEGDDSSPDCWSSNGISPDPGVPSPQSVKCATCPQNQFGSRITESGKQGKACSDSRRIAVVPAGDIENERWGGPMLLRVAGKSAREDLRDYGHLLKVNKVPFYAVVTKLSFDNDASYPKINFAVDSAETRKLTGEDARAIIALRDSDIIARILSTEPAAPPPVPRVEMSPHFAEQEKPAPAKPEVKQEAKPKAEAKPEAQRPSKDPDLVEVKEVTDDALDALVGSLINL